MVGYENPSKGIDSGIFRSKDGRKSVRAFYDYFDTETYPGSRGRFASLGERSVRELDCRDKDNKKITTPKWLRGDATHQTDDGKSYRVTYTPDGVWYLSPATDSDGE
jgi:hypothetical protein